MEAISEHAATMQSTPFRHFATPEPRTSEPCWSPSPGTYLPVTPLSTNDNCARHLHKYNAVMDELAENVSRGRQPLMSTVTSWDETTGNDRKTFVEKAIEDCLLVCENIAPNNGKHLFEAVASEEQRANVPLVDSITKSLMTAYSNASNRNTKIQILSLYAHNFSISTLKKIHAPYGKLSVWQIRRARTHARVLGPGTAPDQKKHHRTRIDMTKLDHFIDFTNRPYFYQDVSYGSKILKLDNGETIEMPNVVRTVTRSTMISQYVEFCEEEQCEPLSRSTLFKILEVREASQRKSLQGLDNTAADGASGFNTIATIVDDLEKAGLDTVWCTNVKERLKKGKRYLKTDYRVHCRPDDALSPDHCRKFALSDDQDPDFQEECSHEHTHTCNECDNVRDVLEEVEEKIRSSDWHSYNKEQQDDLLYDFNQAKVDIMQWKAHIIRSINQESAKQDELKIISSDSKAALIVMDWAMKFVQLKYREKQSEWYGKRGLSWHITTVICCNPDQTDSLELQSYAHIFDSCQQDWFAVCSIIENTLKLIKSEKPYITNVYLRSDEAGCYHNNFLLAAVRDVGKRVGIEVSRYDFSEPQYGKDVCDRILCPMKSTIRRYCNEGHDVVNARDMRTALSERPVRGTSACVCSIDEAKKSLDVNKIDGFSKLHNVEYEEDGVRVWKAYGVGPGKRIPYDEIVNKRQEGTCLVVDEDCFPCQPRVYKCKQTTDSENGDSELELALFPCSEPGCQKVFQTFADLESHLDIGDHTLMHHETDTLYDKLRRDWANKFLTTNIMDDCASATPGILQCRQTQGDSNVTPGAQRGWALHKPKTGANRFSDKVRQYLTAKFDLGELTGNKADPTQVSRDMRKAKNEQNLRLFTREEWLTKGQVQGFFSRLAASRRRQGNQDFQCDAEDLRGEEEELERQTQVENVAQELALQHPIVYDAYNLCESVKDDTLRLFGVTMLKNMLKHFEVSFKSRELKKDLVHRLTSFIEECPCLNEKRPHSRRA